MSEHIFVVEETNFSRSFRQNRPISEQVELGPRGSGQGDLVQRGALYHGAKVAHRVSSLGTVRGGNNLKPLMINRRGGGAGGNGREKKSV